MGLAVGGLQSGGVGGASLTANQTFSGDQTFTGTNSFTGVNTFAGNDVHTGTNSFSQPVTISDNSTTALYFSATNAGLSWENGASDWVLQKGGAGVNQDFVLKVGATTYATWIYATGYLSTAYGYTSSNATLAFYASGGGAFRSSTTANMQSEAADGATAVAAASDTTTAWSNAAAKLHSFRTNAVEKAYVDIAGQYVGTSFTDDSAVTGDRTVNKVRGINAFAGAATAIVITNSFVTATSLVVCSLQTNDATALIKNVVPAAGSFTITLNAAATGTTKIGWIVHN